MQFGLELTIIAIMLFFNGIFSAYEMSLASISKAQITFLVEQKKHGATAALFMKDRMEASLAVIQLGITLFGAIAAATGGAGVDESLAPYLIRTFGFSAAVAEFLSLVLLIVPLSAVTIIFAELFPKVFALNNKERVCLTLSPAMKVISKIAFPIVAIFEWSVKKLMSFRLKSRASKLSAQHTQGLHELKAAANLARSMRLISPREEKIMLSASELSQRSIEIIMIPIEEVSMIALGSSLSEALIQAHMDMHTRYPVCAEGKNPQSIRGYVNFKDIVATLHLNPTDPSIRGILRPLPSVKRDVLISQMLEKFIQQKTHMALVCDFDDKVLGIITLEDILEELVGEIEDEYDRLPHYVYRYASGWIMGGGVKMATVLTTTDLKVEPEVKLELNLADWFQENWQQPIKVGDHFSYQGLEITVRKIRRKKLSEAYLG